MWGHTFVEYVWIIPGWICGAEKHIQEGTKITMCQHCLKVKNA